MLKHSHEESQFPRLIPGTSSHERSSLPKSGDGRLEVKSDANSIALQLNFLPGHARTMLAELNFTALDCVSLDALELSDILGISENLAKAVHASLRVKTETLLLQATQAPSREAFQVTAPPVQTKRSWLPISLQARAGPVRCLVQKKAKLGSVQDRREKRLDTIFDVGSLSEQRR